MKKVYPGIIKVGYLPCDLLSPFVALRGRAGSPVAVLTDINYVEIVGEGKLSSTSQTDKKGEVEVATLEFFTNDEIPSREELAWVAESANGDAYLVGAKEPPYPEIEVNFSAGGRDERAGNTVKVTYKSIKALVKMGV